MSLNFKFLVSPCSLLGTTSLHLFNSLRQSTTSIYQHPNSIWNKEYFASLCFAFLLFSSFLLLPYIFFSSLLFSSLLFHSLSSICNASSIFDFILPEINLYLLLYFILFYIILFFSLSIYLLILSLISSFTKYLAPIVLSIVANWNIIFIKNGPEIQMPGILPAVITSTVGKPPMKVRNSDFWFNGKYFAFYIILDKFWIVTPILL